MKKFISEVRSEVPRRRQPWLKIKSALVASFTRLINKRPGKNSKAKLNGTGPNSTPESSKERAVQQDTDLGGADRQARG